MGELNTISESTVPTYNSGEFLSMATSADYFRRNIPKRVGEWAQSEPLKMGNNVNDGAQIQMIQAAQYLWNEGQRNLLSFVFGGYAMAHRDQFEIQLDTPNIIGETKRLKTIDELSDDERAEWTT